MMSTAAAAKRRATRAAIQRRLRQRPEEQIKARARSAVKRALQTGDLTRSPCAVCGEARSEAHHEDYSKPLEVEWLCRRHHAERHGHAMAPERVEGIKARLRAGEGVKAIGRDMRVEPRVVRQVRDGKYGSIT